MKTKDMIRILVVLCVFALIMVFPVTADSERRFAFDFDPPTENTDGSPISGPLIYRIYICSSYENCENKIGDIYIENYISGRTSSCLDLPDSVALDYFFTGVTARYDNARESEQSNVICHLYGDIYATCDTDFFWSTVRIDGYDLSTLASLWGIYVTHTYYNCEEDFQINFDQTNAQRADINKDGRIDGLDLMILGTRWGKGIPMP